MSVNDKMNESPSVMSNVVDIDMDNFQEVIIEQSKQQLIVIGFWTPRDQACMQLMNDIELVLRNAPVTFAKIDVDTQAQLAMQFGIQSVPTVALFRDVKPVDSFVGSKSSEELAAFFAPHLPKEQDNLLTQAMQLLAEQDYVGAYTPAKQAYQLDSERTDIKLTFAEAALNTGKLADAEHLLTQIRLVDQDSRYQSLLSAIELAKTAAESPEIQALQQQLSENPDDMTLQLKLAVQLNQSQRHEEALALLFTVLQKDLAYGDAKKLFLDILSTLPTGDDVAVKYRRKLYSLLY